MDKNVCPICNSHFMSTDPSNNFVVHMITFHTSISRSLCAVFEYVKDWNTFMAYMRVALKAYDEVENIIFLTPPPLDKSK